MTQLSQDEAKSLASVFGEPDRHKTILLLCFQKPRSQFEVLNMMKKLPKAYEVPRATLYRKVDELYKSRFLELVSEREWARGNIGGTVRYYRLSFKGLIATYIFTYILSVASRIPTTVEEKLETNQLAKRARAQESAPSWNFVISFLKWHRDRGISLRHAKIDMAYFGLTLALSLLDHPKDVSEQDLHELYDELRRYGFVPPLELKDAQKILRSAKKSLREFERVFLATLLGEPKNQLIASANEERNKS